MGNEYIESRNLTKNITVNGNTVIGFLNAQIGFDCTSINISVQVIDRTLLDLNKDLFNKDYYEFLEKVTMSAIKDGWDVLEKQIPTEETVEGE